MPQHAVVYSVCPDAAPTAIEASNSNACQPPSAAARFWRKWRGEVPKPPSSSPGSSAPYKRQTYFNELLSQWQLQEPPIAQDVERAIVEEYSAGYIDGIYSANLTKNDVNRLLRLVSKRPEFADNAKRLMDKYFEKWRRIRFICTGAVSYGKNAPEWVLAELRHMFFLIQVPFTLRVRRPGRRYSMISYSYLFRRFFELLRIPEVSLAVLAGPLQPALAEKAKHVGAHVLDRSIAVVTAERAVLVY